MLSIVMTYKSDGGMRDRHYAFIKSWYKKTMPEAEVIIEEQKENDGIKFYRSALINQGVKRAKGDVILITDIDILIEPGAIKAAVQSLNDKCRFVYPFGYIAYTTESQAERIMKEGKCLFRRGEYTYVRDWYNSTTRPSGINVVRKDDFLRYGGYDERYEYWGSEDGAFLRMMETMYGHKVKRQENLMVHLWHPTRSDKGANRDKYNGRYTAQYDKAYGDKEAMQKIIDEAMKAKR